MKTLILAGGSGFIGKKFMAYAAARDYRCIVLTRNPNEENDVHWDAVNQGEWGSLLEEAHAVVNFTGRPINCLHNAKNRKDILESRTNSVAAINTAIDACKNPPKVYVQSGSLAIFGDTKEVCTDDAPRGHDFTADVCAAWEDTFFQKTTHETRKCYLRIALVLGTNGGALSPLRTLTKCFLGGTVGRGNQYMSWIHEGDMCRLLMACIEDETMHGAYNASSPNPVTNKEFMRAMRHAMNRPWSPPAPELAVKLGATLIMRVQPNLVLVSQRGFPKRLLDHGFEFTHSKVAEAIQEVNERWGDKL